MKIKKQSNQGFTIVELIAVIVIIAILSALMFISYGSTRDKAENTAIQSDLSNASDRLVIEQANSSTGDFPSSLPASITFGENTDTDYLVDNDEGEPKTFCLTATSDSQSYFITQEGISQPGICPALYLDANTHTSYPGSGSSWFDLSGHRHDADICNCLYASEGGRALTFNGTSSYARVDNPSCGRLNFGTGSFTIEVWLKFGAYAEYKNLIYKGASSGLSGWRFGVSTTGLPHFLIGDTVSYKESAIGSTTLSLNNWHHLAIVYNRTSNAVGYIDGVKVGSVDISTKNGSVDNADQVHIGESYTRYTGQIGIVYIRSGAMSDSDVNKSFEALRGRYGI